MESYMKVHLSDSLQIQVAAPTHHKYKPSNKPLITTQNLKVNVNMERIISETK